MNRERWLVREREKREGWDREETVNRGTIGENAIRNSTSLARQTPTPCVDPALDHPPQLQPPYPARSLAGISVPPRAALASLVDEFRVCCQSLFRAIISQHFDMTYKPTGEGNGYYRGYSGEQRQGRGCMREKEDEEEEEEAGKGEDSGRTPVPRSWILEGLFVVRGRRWRREKERKRGAVSRYVRGTGGCNTCTWHGQCIRYPTNALNPSTPHLERNPEFPHCHPCSSPLLLSRARDVPFSTPAYPSAGRCVQFADVKCNIHLSPPSWNPIRALFPSCPLSSLPLPLRNGLCTVYASSMSTRVYRLVSIMRTQARWASRRKEW